MELTSKLLMTFKCANGKNVSLSVDEPRDGATEQEIKTVMDLIVSKNIFTPNGSEIVEAVEAKVVITNTTPYDLVIG